MHLPSGSLDNLTCTATTVLAAGATAYAWTRTRRVSSEVQPARFAAVAAFVFAAQMVNFAAGGGISGHLVGGAFAGTLLGPWLGQLSMTLVLFAQCLLAGDGGLDTLGANVLTMGMAAVWTGAVTRRVLNFEGANAIQHGVATALSAWLSVMAAAAICVSIWALGSIATFAEVIGRMLTVHARIGVGEALITTAAMVAISVCSNQAPSTWRQRERTMGLCAALAVALLLAPFASVAPDGLESVAAVVARWTEAVSTWPVLTPDYHMPGVANEMVATGLAGALGTLLVFFAARYCWHPRLGYFPARRASTLFKLRRSKRCLG